MEASYHPLRLESVVGDQLVWAVESTFQLENVLYPTAIVGLPALLYKKGAELTLEIAEESFAVI